MISKALLVSLAVVGSAFAQSGTRFCDSASSICFQGFTDPDLGVTVGLVLPPLTSPPSDELLVQLVAPKSTGFTGLSLGGSMANSLLFTLWANGNNVVLGPRWTSGYALPTTYVGPKVTLLPSSTVNSTHVKATFRCQNCTTWAGGSLGSGDLTSYQVLAYVVGTSSTPANLADAASTIQQHDYFNFLGVDLSAAHDPNYSAYINGTPITVSVPPASSTPASSSSVHSSSVPPSTSSSAPTAVQTQWGQCAGVGYTGPTACASGLTCVAVSPPYYSQCQAV